jgi:hypothetical protein
MNRRQVWVRPLGSITTKIRVSGAESAVWVRGALQKNGVECTQPMELRNSSFCAFRALHVNRIDHQKLIEIMRQIPDVDLIFEPA